MSNMTDIASEDNKLSDIILKVKKITEALYRITDFFQDEEPLKWTLRKDAVKILDSFLSAENHSDYERIKMIRCVSAMVGKMLNFIELASFGSFIAKSNFEVLRKEYGLVLTFVLESKFSEADFLINDELALTRPENPISSPFFNPGKAKNELVINVNGGVSNFDNSDGFMKKPVDNGWKSGNGGLHFNSRHAKILSLVADKKEVSAGDICPHFNGISEKTIQRDLIFLVNRGLLDMSGDRRWRRYVLKMIASSSSNI